MALYKKKCQSKMTHHARSFAGAAYVLVACTAVPTFSVDPDAATQTDAGLATSDAAASADATKTTGFRIFVTKKRYAGNFAPAGGGSAEDLSSAHCAAAAGEAKLSGHWRALLWTNASTAPSSRISAPQDGWAQVLPGGAPGQPVISRLRGPTLRTNAEIFDEYGHSLPIKDAYAWTGGNLTTPGGVCSNWSDALASGQIGFALKTDDHWLDEGQVPCGKEAHLYCMEVP